MALSMRFFARGVGWLELLSRNALGIFVLHYAPLVWMQSLLARAPLPAISKALIVFATALPLSLALAMAMRKFGRVAWLIGEEPEETPPRGRSSA